MPLPFTRLPDFEPPAFAAPARPRHALWRTLIGTVLVTVIWFAVTGGILSLAALVSWRPLDEIYTGAYPEDAVAFFISFIGMHIGLVVALALLHRRRWSSLFGPARPRQFLIAAGVALALGTLLGLVMLVEPLFLPEVILPGFRAGQVPGRWLLWLPVTLGVVLVQASAEELMFRGYLLQQLAARFRSPWIWAALPSFLFGLLHFDAETFGVPNASLYVVNAGVMGTLAALITIRTGSISAAIGFHFANNVATTVLGMDGMYEGLTLVVADMDLAGPYATYSLAMNTAAMLVAWLVWSRLQMTPGQTRYGQP